MGIITERSLPRIVSTVYALPLVLSTTSTETLGGLTFNNQDLVEFDPADPNTATLYYDGTPIAANANVDALHVLSNGDIVERHSVRE